MTGADWFRHCKNENLGVIVEWKPKVWGTKMSRGYSAKKFVRPADRSRLMGNPEWAKELDVCTNMLILRLCAIPNG